MSLTQNKCTFSFWGEGAGCLEGEMVVFVGFGDFWLFRICAAATAAATMHRLWSVNFHTTVMLSCSAVDCLNTVVLSTGYVCKPYTVKAWHTSLCFFVACTFHLVATKRSVAGRYFIFRCHRSSVHVHETPTRSELPAAYAGKPHYKAISTLLSVPSVQS